MQENILKTILIDNLIDYEEFKNDPNSVSSIECFHFNIPASPKFTAFTGLKELRIIEQDVADLSFLSDLPNLEILLVYHTLLKDTKGLKFCPNLRSVILESNKISELPDLCELKNLEIFSIADNPLEKMPEFVEISTLKDLNIASCNLPKLPSSIARLQRLETLNVAANHIHSFKVFDIIKKLPNLKTLYFEDPNYGSNPICTLPNYDIMVGCCLQQVDVIDTFTMSKKFKQVCEGRKREAKLFYATTSAIDCKDCESIRRNFYDQMNKNIAELGPSSSLSQEKLKQIDKICFSFEHTMKEMKFLAQELPLLSYRTAGLVRSTKLIEGYKELDDFLVSISSKFAATSFTSPDVSADPLDKTNVVSVWEVSNIGAEIYCKNENIHEKQPVSKFVLFKSAEECLSAIDNWTECNHEYRDSIPSNKSESFSTFCVVCCSVVVGDDKDESQTNSFPTHVALIATPVDAQIIEIEDITREMVKSGSDVQEEENEETLCVIQRSFSLSPQLTTVTLIDCGVTSLSQFSGMTSLTYLNLMFNRIETLSDLPVLPQLEVLDLSFNAISDVNQMIPLDMSATNSIKEIYIIGNPVYSPTTQKFADQIFQTNRVASISRPGSSHRPLSSSQRSRSSSSQSLRMSLSNKRLDHQILYSPPNDDSLFLTQISAASLENITYINLSSNCLTTLKPLSKIPRLTKLIATNNQLTAFDLASQTLTSADVSSNFITELPIQSTLPALQFLSITHNCIKQLSPFTSLLCLFVSSNEIEVLPASTFFPLMIVLSIEDNPISSEVDQQRFLYQYKTLKVLNGTPIKQAQHNKVQNALTGILFAEELETLLQPGQTVLKLDDKGYKDVNILSSDSVQTLSLRNNNLTDIKWSKNAFPKLLQLDVSQNSLQNFDFIQNFQHLRALDLSNNKIGDQLMKQFSTLQLKSLKQLTLSNNSLRTISLTTFPCSNFPSLEFLDLSHNFIMQIERRWFGDLNIVSLDLSYNSLKKLDGLNIPTINSLDVSHNRITTVDEVEKLRPCTNMKRFCFNDNPLNQRAIPRIRVLCILRSLQEMDNKTVTENDLIQVKQILDQQNAGYGVFSEPQTTQPGRVNRINNVMLTPNLPSLQGTPTSGKRKPMERSRFPRV